MVVPLVGIKINIAKSTKRKQTIVTEGTVISRDCKAIVIKDDEGFKAKISLNNDTENPDILVIPFTTKSYDIKGKEIIFSKERIDNNRFRCIIRDKASANLYNDTEHYTPFRENIVITGYIVRLDGKMYFQYKDFISFNPFVKYYKPCLTNEDKPVFNK